MFQVVAVLGHKLEHQGFLWTFQTLVVVREPLDHLVLPFVHEARQQPELDKHIWQVGGHVELVCPEFGSIALLVQLQMLHDSGREIGVADISAPGQSDKQVQGVTQRQEARYVIGASCSTWNFSFLF